MFNKILWLFLDINFLCIAFTKTKKILVQYTGPLKKSLLWSTHGTKYIRQQAGQLIFIHGEKTTIRTLCTWDLWWPYSCTLCSARQEEEEDTQLVGTTHFTSHTSFTIARGLKVGVTRLAAVARWTEDTSHVIGSWFLVLAAYFLTPVRDPSSCSEAPFCLSDRRKQTHYASESGVAHSNDLFDDHTGSRLLPGASW